MFINEVCKKCSLTKKAIDYYEKQGLVNPKVGENGYRNYSDKDVSILIEISVLRKLGLSVADTKKVMESSNKSLALSKYKYLIELKQQRSIEQQRCVERLIKNYDIENEKEYIESTLNWSISMKEKLVHAFPGMYGLYLSIHFGQFLNEKIDCEEKEEAYTRIVHYLDRVNITTEMEEDLESFIPFMETEKMETMNSAILNTVEDIENYIENNKEQMEMYIKFRNSDAYKLTPAYKMQQVLLKLQQTSGYYEEFIGNLKVLSDSYREYTEKLEQANKILIKTYPETAEFYEKE